jgi:amidase
LALSGEPLIPDLRESLKLREPLPLLTTYELTLQGLAYELQYSDYWNSTAEEDGNDSREMAELLLILARPDR